MSVKVVTTDEVRPLVGRKATKSSLGVVMLPAMTVATTRLALVSKCQPRREEAIWVVGLIGGGSLVQEKAPKVVGLVITQRQKRSVSGQHGSTGVGSGS